jgi:hypothetical protein
VNEEAIARDWAAAPCEKKDNIFSANVKLERVNIG